MQTDFFGMFMIGIEVIDEVKTTSEFKQVFPERDWMEFKNAVTWLDALRTLRGRFESLRQLAEAEPNLDLAPIAKAPALSVVAA